MAHRIVGSLVFLAMGNCIAGCMTPPSPANWLGSETGAAVQAVVEKFAEQGTIDRMVAGVRGNVHDPGMEAYVNIRTSVGVRVVGADGSVQIDTTGSGPMDPNVIPDWAKPIVQGYIDRNDLEGLRKFLTIIGPFP